MLFYSDVVTAATELISSMEYYQKQPIFLIHNAFMPAFKYNKYIVDYKNGRMQGLVTYGFINNTELETQVWKGEDLYKREYGTLYLPQFFHIGSTKEKCAFVRRIIKELSHKYPEHKVAFSVRYYQDGTRRPELWYRKDKQ